MTAVENLIFGSIGISNKIQPFPFAKVYTNNNSAGIPSLYNFEFKTSVPFPKESYLKIILDQNSGFILQSKSVGSNLIDCKAI
jgi:hypothetical protein